MEYFIRGLGGYPPPSKQTYSMSGILESFPYSTENVMSLTYFPYFVSASWVTPSPFQLISQDDNILQVRFVLL